MGSWSATATVWELAWEWATARTRPAPSSPPQQAMRGSGSNDETSTDARPTSGQERDGSVSERDPDLGPLHAAAKVRAIDLDGAGACEIRGHDVLDLDLDLVPHRGKAGADIVRNTRVDLELFALVVDTRTARRGLGPVAVIDRVHHGLHHGAHDLATARRATHEK